MAVAAVARVAPGGPAVRWPRRPRWWWQPWWRWRWCRGGVVAVAAVGGGGGVSSGKRYNLNFNAQIQNLFNTTNYATPSGNLNSRLPFGKTLQLNSNAL